MRFSRLSFPFYNYLGFFTRICPSVRPSVRKCVGYALSFHLKNEWHAHTHTRCMYIVHTNSHARTFMTHRCPVGLVPSFLKKEKRGNNDTSKGRGVKIPANEKIGLISLLLCVFFVWKDIAFLFLRWFIRPLARFSSRGLLIMRWPFHSFQDFYYYFQN